MSKELDKAIIKRSKLRYIFLKPRKDTNKKTTAPKEISVKNSRKTLRNLGTKKLIDNRSFWKTVIPLFTPKFQQKLKN